MQTYIRFIIISIRKTLAIGLTEKMGGICADLHVTPVHGHISALLIWPLPLSYFARPCWGNILCNRQIRKTETKLGLELPILYCWNRALTNDDSSNNISVVRLSHIPSLKLAGTGELRMNTRDIFIAKKAVYPLEAFNIPKRDYM